MRRAAAFLHLSPSGRGRREAAGEGANGNGYEVGEVQIESRAVAERADNILRMILSEKSATFRDHALAEARLWQALRNRRLAQWKFRRQHPIDRFVVDFVTIDRKLIVEVDGVTHASPAAVIRDTERTRILESLGFLMVRVTV